MEAASPAPAQAADDSAHAVGMPEGIHGLDADPNAADDPLLACLVFLTKFHGRPKSASVLMAGLPKPEGRMSTSLFQRAAARAGLLATVVHRDLSGIHKWTLPAVLALKDGDAVVLIERQADGRCVIVTGDGGEGTTAVPMDELAAQYSGYAILVKPEFAFTGQQYGADVPRPQSWFWGTLANNWWTYAQVVLASVLINLFALANPLFTMNVYDRVLPNAAIETGVVLAVGTAAVLLFDLLLKNLRGWFIDFVGRRADVVLACRIFDQVLDMKISHRPPSSGAFAGMLREFETVRDFFTSATLAAFIDLPFSILFVTVISLISLPIGLIIAFAMAVVFIWGIVIQIPIARNIRSLMGQGESKHGLLIESINGIETIKMVGAEGRMRALWERLVGQNAALGQRTKLFNNLGVNFVQFVQQLTSVLIVVMGVFLVKDGLLTAGGLIASVMLSGRSLGPMAQVSQLMMRFHQAWSSLKSLDGLMESPVERPAQANFVHRPRLIGQIDFKEVSFRYPGTEHDVLSDISFSIEPGQRVGIVGRVGSGKSTIAKLLAGLYDPTEGTVLMDNTDLRQIEPSDVRANMGFVPQDLFLFRGTIKENIAIAVPHANDSEITEVAEAVGLHDFVTHHPLGYDLQVGERGDGLSGGQRQAVALARALLKHPSMLVMDEPTSSMDIGSETQVIDALPKFMEGKTIVLITHRTSMLKLVDRLIVLDHGKIVADGSRDSILEMLARGRIASGT